jgi:hypothetical protein
MAAVVAVERRCLAGCTEVGIWANSTLESGTTDRIAAPILLANGTIAVHSAVDNAGKRDALLKRGHGLVVKNRNEPMARMEFGRRSNAVVAVVPVRAVDALVTNSHNALIAAVAERGMMSVATARKECLLISGQDEGAVGTGKGVARIMSMFPIAQASNAKIEVLAILAHDTLLVREICIEISHATPDHKRNAV